MTHTKDEALKLALEALKFCRDNENYGHTSTLEAIAAIKQALAAPVQEPVAYEYWEEVYWHTNPALNDYIRANGKELVYATTPAAQRQWVDPNDKTQEQYLPHIGEPVLFCHEGKTYMGKHTGGSFQSEVTNQYFNTWFCHWMYLPAAHGIKEKP
jgi:hypothetical protein